MNMMIERVFVCQAAVLALALSGGMAKASDEPDPEAQDAQCQSIVQEVAESLSGEDGEAEATAEGLVSQYGSMRKACGDFRGCKKKCRASKKECRLDAKDGKKDCKSECAKLKGKEKRACKKKCRQTKRSSKKECRTSKKDCKKTCIKEFRKGQCSDARKTFWKTVGVTLGKAAEEALRAYSGQVRTGCNPLYGGR